MSYQSEKWESVGFSCQAETMDYLEDISDDNFEIDEDSDSSNKSINYNNEICNKTGKSRKNILFAPSVSSQKQNKPKVAIVTSSRNNNGPRKIKRKRNRISKKQKFLNKSIEMMTLSSSNSNFPCKDVTDPNKGKLGKLNNNKQLDDGRTPQISLKADTLAHNKRGSYDQNVNVSSNLQYLRTHNLIKNIQDKKIRVFHCDVQFNSNKQKLTQFQVLVEKNNLKFSDYSNQKVHSEPDLGFRELKKVDVGNNSNICSPIVSSHTNTNEPLLDKICNRAIYGERSVTADINHQNSKDVNNSQSDTTTQLLLQSSENYQKISKENHARGGSLNNSDLKITKDVPSDKSCNDITNHSKNNEEINKSEHNNLDKVNDPEKSKEHFIITQLNSQENEDSVEMETKNIPHGSASKLMSTASIEVSECNEKQLMNNIKMSHDLNHPKKSRKNVTHKLVMEQVVDVGNNSNISSPIVTSHNNTNEPLLEKTSNQAIYAEGSVTADINHQKSKDVNNSQSDTTTQLLLQSSENYQKISKENHASGGSLNNSVLKITKDVPSDKSCDDALTIHSKSNEEMNKSEHNNLDKVTYPEKSKDYLRINKLNSQENEDFVKMETKNIPDGKASKLMSTATIEVSECNGKQLKKKIKMSQDLNHPKKSRKNVTHKLVMEQVVDFGNNSNISSPIVTSDTNTNERLLEKTSNQAIYAEGSVTADINHQNSKDLKNSQSDTTKLLLQSNEKTSENNQILSKENNSSTGSMNNLDPKIVNNNIFSVNLSKEQIEKYQLKELKIVLKKINVNLTHFSETKVNKNSRQIFGHSDGMKRNHSFNNHDEPPNKMIHIHSPKLAIKDLKIRAKDGNKRMKNNECTSLKTKQKSPPSRRLEEYLLTTDRKIKNVMFNNLMLTSFVDIYKCMDRNQVKKVVIPDNIYNLFKMKGSPRQPMYPNLKIIPTSSAERYSRFKRTRKSSSSEADDVSENEINLPKSQAERDLRHLPRNCRQFKKFKTNLRSTKESLTDGEIQSIQINKQGQSNRPIADAEIPGETLFKQPRLKRKCRNISKKPETVKQPIYKPPCEIAATKDTRTEQAANIISMHPADSSGDFENILNSGRIISIVRHVVNNKKHHDMVPENQENTEEEESDDYFIGFKDDTTCGCIIGSDANPERCRNDCYISRTHIKMLNLNRTVDMCLESIRRLRIFRSRSYEEMEDQESNSSTKNLELNQQINAKPFHDPGICIMSVGGRNSTVVKTAEEERFLSTQSNSSDCSQLAVAAKNVEVIICLIFVFTSFHFKMVISLLQLVMFLFNPKNLIYVKNIVSFVIS